MTYFTEAVEYIVAFFVVWGMCGAVAIALTFII